jgi:hypothetical protein
VIGAGRLDCAGAYGERRFSSSWTCV